MIVRRVILTSLTLWLAAAPAFAQNIHSPVINTESPQGKLLAEAGMAEDPAERAALLEKFLEQFSDDPLTGYTYYQLVKTYNELEQYDKAVVAGEKLLAIAPDDIEARHQVNQAKVNARQWDGLAESLDKTRSLAEAELALPKPDDEAKAAEWQAQQDYASGVLQWLEWATNTAATQHTDPAKKVEWLDRLAAGYPDGEYAADLEARYIAVYQELGNQEKMYEWMSKAVEGEEAPSLAYLYSLGENALYNQNDPAAAQQYAQRMLDQLEAKGEEIPEEERTKFTAYANFILGSAWVRKNTKDAFRVGRRHLLQAADFIKAEGGPRYNILAYYLGVCYVELDIQGDNIRKALHWMTEAANSPGPYQAQGKQALDKIKAAI